MPKRKDLASSSSDAEDDEIDKLECSFDALEKSSLSAISEGSHISLSDERISLEGSSSTDENASETASKSFKKAKFMTHDADVNLPVAPQVEETTNTSDDEFRAVSNRAPYVFEEESSQLDLNNSAMLDLSFTGDSTSHAAIVRDGAGEPLLEHSFAALEGDIDDNIQSRNDLGYAESDDESISESQDESYDLKDILDPPIFSGAKISVNDSMVAILTFAIRHQLNGQAIADLLELINLHLGVEENALKTSLYFFKKYFANQKTNPKFHYFCSTCLVKLPDYKTVCPNINQHQSNSNKSFFVELPLIPQIEALYSNETFWNNFNHRFKRNKLHENYVEDIYDGQLYKELIQSGFLSDMNNFSLLVFSDGVPVFKSSTHGSVWPLYFSINELPYKMRVSKEYMLVGGLWYGAKPAVNIMLEPLVESFACLKEGISVTPFGSINEINVKGILLAGTFDLPAKAVFLGMMQYNGNFGCQICKSKGESVQYNTLKPKKNVKDQTESKKTAWVYRFSKALELRRHDETVRFGEEAHKMYLALKPNADPGKININVFGVKHPSIIFKIMYDAIRGIGIDELHTLYLGVTTKLTTLWFDPKHSSEPYSLRPFLNVVDNRLRKICPPNFIQRGIRSIEVDFPHWKGNEKKVWLLYLSIPVLTGIMKERYLEHHSLLVSSIHMLLASSIAPDSILLCAKQLDQYVQQFEQLYGTQHMLMNIHLLQHLPFVVNNLGPLWCYSCFPYESINGEIISMIHGTRYIETQMASCAYLICQLPHALKTLRSQNVQNFCYKILHPMCRLKKQDTVSDTIFTVGSNHALLMLPLQVKSALEAHGITSGKFHSFHKLKKDNFLFVSRSYIRAKKNISYVASFKHKGTVAYGAIDMFIKVSCECETSCTC